MEPSKLSKREKQRIQRETVINKPISQSLSSTNIPWLPSILVAIVAFVLYANTLGHQYALDDYSLILENRITQKGLDGIPEILSNSYRYGYYMATDGLYRPVVRIMLAAEWEWGGGKPALGHWINVILFALSGFVLFRVLFKMTGGSLMIAFMAALLFACHPIHTEVVANIKSRDEILAFLFCLLSLDHYLKWLDSRAWLPAALSGLFMFLAMGSKESAITFLAVLPLAAWFFNKDVSFQKNIQGVFPALIAVVVFMFIRSKVLGGFNTLGKPNVADNLLMAAKDQVEFFCTAVSILGLYIKKLLIPHPLVFDYSFNQIPLVGISDFGFLLSASVIIGMVVFAFIGFKKRDPFAFCILFFFVTMSVSSNLVIKTGSSFGERFLYTPSLAICLALAFGISKFAGLSFQGRPQGKSLSMSLLILLPLVLLGSVKTIARNPVWKDNFSLYSNDVELSPNSTRAQYYMGNYLVKKEAWEGKSPDEKSKTLKRAIGYLQRSIQIYDKFSDAHLQLGVAYYNLGMNDSARVCYEKALSLSPRNHTIQNNLGTIYFIQQDYAKALDLFKRAVELDPNYADGQSNLGSTYGVLQQYDQALIHLLKAAELDPDNAQILNSLGTTYRFKGDERNAVLYFEKAYSINPALRPKS
ncbi:MAG: tetratricopeptide repeat protein [Bacteroidota bacterium]